ncbi:hypothetical protein HRbin36_01338 [bacterium HR36]|nr:hypothetical protein HRbin36_01338 [bacterium HR36]
MRSPRHCFTLHRPGRQAFSLVEMLVVLAIMLLVMSILAMAYDAALRAMRIARGLAIGSTDLGNFERELRFLLRQRHFEGDLRVSEIDSSDPSRQPKEGFFAVIEGNQPIGEIDVDDGLNFTVRLIGNSPGDFFETLAPPGFASSSPTGYPESRYQQGDTYRSQWAEIAIFLSGQPDGEDPSKQAATVPTDHPAHPDNGGPAARLYRLHIRKLLLFPSHFAKGPQDFDPPPAVSSNPQQYDFSVGAGGQVNKPTDVATDKKNRFWPPQPLPGNRQGEDVILTNVVSFDVKVIQNGAVNDSSYDSSANQPLQGIWIRIRVFEPKTQQMRDIVINESL